MAISISTALAVMPSALPEFKNEKQLQQWRAEKRSEATPEAQDEQIFYTGKPKLNGADSYSFKFRSYDSALSRWTSEDPSGFPDGANSSIYAPIPTSEIDANGLWTLSLIDDSNRMASDTGTVNTGWINGNEAILASVSLHYSASGDTSGIVTGVGLGSISPHSDFTTTVIAGFNIGATSTGSISISPASGSWHNTDNDLQTAMTYATQDLGDNKYKLTLTVSSIYNGTGLTGAGIAGSSISWSSGGGQQTAYASMTFQAVE